MLDARTGEPLSDHFVMFGHPTVFLAASPKGTPPEITDVVVERHERIEVSRHGVEGEVACDDLTKPSALFSNGLVHLSSQRSLISFSLAFTRSRRDFR